MACNFDSSVKKLDPTPIIRQVCEEFYNKHKRSMCSIVLTGSLARGEVSLTKTIYDADIVLVTRHYYNPILCSSLERNLKSRLREVKFDVGRSYPLSRLTKEKSLFLYDIRNSGVILAGENVKNMIQPITPSDLYPFECIRLLLNATCHLAFSLHRGEDEIKGGLDKAMRWLLDAFLLYKRKFASTHRERKEIARYEYPEFFQNVQEVMKCYDKVAKYEKGRHEMLCFMELVKEDLALDRIEDLVDFLKKENGYPISFRIYAFTVHHHFKSFLANPIFDVYSWAVKILSTLERPVAPRNLSNLRHMEEMWTRLPQPMIGRGE